MGGTNKNPNSEDSKKVKKPIRYQTERRSQGWKDTVQTEKENENEQR